MANSYEKACQGKNRFLSRRQAKQWHNNSVFRKQAMRPYQCDYCGLYHLGHREPGAGTGLRGRPDVESWRDL